MRIRQGWIEIENSNGQTAMVIQADYNKVCLKPTMNQCHDLELGDSTFQWRSVRIHAGSFYVGGTEFKATRLQAPVGKCALCEHEAYIENVGMKFCDVCYFAFARTPALKRLLETWQPKP